MTKEQWVAPGTSGGIVDGLLNPRLPAYFEHGQNYTDVKTFRSTLQQLFNDVRNNVHQVQQEQEFNNSQERAAGVSSLISRLSYEHAKRRK
jgi:hypothetical protein